MKHKRGNKYSKISIYVCLLPYIVLIHQLKEAVGKLGLTKNFTSRKGGVENESSTLEIRYLSKVEMGFTVCLKSPQM